MSEERATFGDLAALVDALLSLAPGERADWIAGLPAPPSVKAALRRIGDSDEGDGGWLESGVAAMLGPASTGSAGQLVGRYRLLRVLGDGGTSVVWLAERDDETRQPVAVKYLKSGLGTPSARERFLVEQKLLANLSHPNIVRMLDLGISNDNVPFIVMEYIDGESITRHASTLPVIERLRLFLTLAAAVSFAHRNLVLHRDLKPGNVMVSRDGVVKLLDFGIGRFLQSDAQTATVQRALTPGYAAPEQFIQATPSTSVDVYSLGAVLYEMLCERPPFADGTRRNGAPCDPIKPSDAIAMTNPGATSRRAALVGDLDAIVMQAMQHDPESRYASVDALAEDVQRHIDRRPIVARAPTLVYRARRFFDRHRWGVLSTAVALLLVCVGIGMIVSANHNIRQERNRADQSLAFVESLFRNEWREHPKSGLPSTAELLDRGAARAHAELAGDPAGLVQVLSWIGRAYLGSDRPSDAARIFEQASQAAGQTDQVPAESRRELQLATWTAMLQAGAEPEQILRLLRDSHDPNDSPAMHARILALEAACRDAQNDYDTADTLLGRALSILEAVPSDADAEQRAKLWLSRSQIASNQSRHALAAQYAEQGLAEAEKAQHAPPSLAVDARIAKAMALMLNGDARAEAALRDALAFTTSLSDSPNLATALVQNALGNWLAANGGFVEAATMLSAALQTREQLLGPDHVLTQDTQGDSLLLAKRMGRLDEAERGYRAQLAARRASGTATPARTAILVGNLADVLIDRGLLEEAEPLVRESLQLRRESLGEFSVGTPYYYAWRIAILRGELTRALATVQEAMAILDRGDRDSLERGLILLCLADTQRQLGQLTDARVALDEVHALHRGRIPDNHVRWGLIHLVEAEWQWDSGQRAEAAASLAAAEPLFRSGLYYHPTKRGAFERLRRAVQAGS